MKRSELFALTAGVIGLIADVIALTVFFSPNISGSVNNAASPTTASKVLIAGLMIYGWFLISWMLVRRAWVRKAKKLSTQDKGWTIFNRRLNYTIAATGLLLLPLQALFLSILFPFDDPFFRNDPSEPSKIEWFMFLGIYSVASLGVIGMLMSLAIGALMPVIYEDMEDL